MLQKLKNSLALQIFIAMIIGAVLGITAGEHMLRLGFIGDSWMNCIKMVMVPMILAAVISGIVSQKDIASLGRVAASILVYYTLTTAFACVIGITVTTLLKPGTWTTLEGIQGAEVSGTINITPQIFFMNLFSDNIFKTFTDGNILQTLVIAIIVGIAILLMKEGEARSGMIKAINVFNEFVGSWISLVMKVSPIGILFLMGAAFGEYGLDIFKSMAALAGTFYLACLAQVLLVYGTALFIVTRINPFRFLKDSAALLSCTLATCSSIASIPVNMKTAKEKFNVPDSISSFTIPLGSQLNADGCAIFDACLVIFIAQTVGVTIGFGPLVQTVLTATLLSMGGNGIPGSGIVKTLVLVQALGLPVELVGIVAAFYRVFDMGMTTNNCLGDLVGTVIVSRLESRREAKAASKSS